MGTVYTVNVIVGIKVESDLFFDIKTGEHPARNCEHYEAQASTAQYCSDCGKRLQHKPSIWSERILKPEWAKRLRIPEGWNEEDVDDGLNNSFLPYGADPEDEPVRVFQGFNQQLWIGVYLACFDGRGQDDFEGAVLRLEDIGKVFSEVSSKLSEWGLPQDPCLHLGLDVH